MITWVHQTIMAQRMSCSELQQANRFVHNLDLIDQMPIDHYVYWYLAHKKQPHLGADSRNIPRVLWGS